MTTTSQITHWLRTPENGLVPFDTAADEWLKAHSGSTEPLALAPVHNTRFRAYVFRTLQECARAFGMTLDELRADLLIATERFTRRTLYGRELVIPHSMSPQFMDDDGLAKFWNESQGVLRLMLRVRVTDPAKRQYLDGLLLEDEHGPTRGVAG